MNIIARPLPQSFNHLTDRIKTDLKYNTGAVATTAAATAGTYGVLRGTVGGAATKNTLSALKTFFTGLPKMFPKNMSLGQGAVKFLDNLGSASKGLWKVVPNKAKVILGGGLALTALALSVISKKQNDAQTKIDEKYTQKAEAKKTEQKEILKKEDSEIKAEKTEKPEGNKTGRGEKFVSDIRQSLQDPAMLVLGLMSLPAFLMVHILKNNRHNNRFAPITASHNYSNLTARKMYG